MAQLKKYLKLYLALFRTSFIADLEYRVNFLTRIVTDIFWYMAQILTYEVLFHHTEKIGDWNLAQMRVFLGIVFVVDGIYMIIFSENLDSFSEKVRKGDLDLLLAKPVNSQFMLSLQKASTAMIGNLLLASGWFIYSLVHYPDFQWIRLLWLLVLIPCGLAALYTVRFMIASTAVIFARSENLQFIWFQLYRLGMRPDSIYVPWFKWILLTALPVGVIASVPSRALLEAPDYLLFGWAILLSVILIYSSNKFWKYALKFYSSASS
ncbi:ABC transporter permease [Bdellovibrio reynosensis]|uniref:ABC-2 family transporter protein n=1 Tax=Bdellovibrio reynosensis TaxID=2835041 RepID=A0ABY4C6U8_9BACT|nr:ABC-2 family transporter protein [Bdellovibrio reynosensis]UOF00698.1 ABC-2 family transporter protein [Bdellovibrio reynosensis]